MYNLYLISVKVTMKKFSILNFFMDQTLNGALCDHHKKLFDERGLQ